MRKVYVELKVQVVVEAEEGVDISEVISELAYNFTSQTEDAAIVDTEIEDYDIRDSK